MAVIAGKKAQIKVSGSSVAFTGESTSTTDDQTYQIDDATKRVWCVSCTIIVNEDGSPTTEDYTLNRLTGTITFATVDGTRGVITVDGDYLPMSVAAEAYEFTYTLTGNNVDDNSFGDNYITRKQVLLDATGSISKWAEISSYYHDSLTSGDPIVLEFYSDSGSSFDLKVRAILNTDEMSAAVDGLVEKSVEFEGTNDADGNVAAIPTI